jgi:CBS domain-containing protein
MSVGRICIREVDTAEPSETVFCAAERMHQRAVGTLVVVNYAREPIGLITDRDLVERVLAKGRHPLETQLRDIMTAGPTTVSENSSIESALSVMRSGKFRRLPVVDANQRLVGLISLDDIMMLLSDEFRDVGTLLQKETPESVLAAT